MKDRRNEVGVLRDGLRTVRAEAIEDGSPRLLQAVEDAEGRLSGGDSERAVRLLMGWTLARRLSGPSHALGLR